MDRRTFLRSAPRRLLEGLRGLVNDPPSRQVALLNVSRCLAWAQTDCQICYLRCPLRDRAMVPEGGRPTVVVSEPALKEDLTQ